MPELPNFKHLHDPRFKPYVEAAHEFVKDTGVRHIAPEESVTVVLGEANEQALRIAVQKTLPENQSEPAWYIPEINQTAVIARPDEVNPIEATQRLVTHIEHELTHSGSHNARQHPFYQEALSGMVEHAQHIDWELRGKRRTPASTVLDRAGVELFVPGGYRYHDRETGKANTSQALVAAHSLALAEQAGGIARNDILAATRPYSDEAYRRMRSSLDILRPGLAQEVESYPQTTNGIIQAAAVVQREARSHGILPPLN